MSKYQRLDSNSSSSNSLHTTAPASQLSTTRAHAATPTKITTATTDDEHFSLIFESTMLNHNNNNNNNSMHAANYADEYTMEVPLLTHSNHNHATHTTQQTVGEQQQQQQQQYGRYNCAQAGFAANLKNAAAQDAKCKILLAISLCSVFMIIEFLGGYLAGSLAIMTDAAHLATDCITFIIGLVAIWLGTRPPDRRMSFGYKRMEVLGALVSIVGIWILTAALLVVALQRLASNDYDLDANTMMVISAIGILINIAMIFILHGSSLLSSGGHSHCHGHAHAHTHAHAHSHAHAQTHSHSHSHPPLADTLLSAVVDVDATSLIGNGLKHTQNGVAVDHDEKNLNLRAAMIHVIGDLVQSIGVFLASVLIKFYPHAKFADPLCTLLFSVIVIMTTVRLFKESISIIMDAVPKHIIIDELEMDLMQLEHVHSVHHINVWKHTADFNVLMAHLVIDAQADSNTVLQQATQLAQSAKYAIKHCTIQIEHATSLTA